MRKLLGVVAGIAVAILVIMAIEFAGHAAYPPPPDIDLRDPAATNRLIASLPPGALAGVVIGWFLGSFAGAWTAIRVARWATAGWIVVAFVIAGGLYTIITIPHPMWMQIAAVALPLLAGWMALRINRAGRANIA